ncbi:MAG: LPS assembly lipoprotein LptE [Desulfobacca sp.]|uniref:LPS assembly lipoprotein LptE n=1 Tax=Desulfobacca sp. TaxID=2067990 RepID=UPI00404942EF
MAILSGGAKGAAARERRRGQLPILRSALQVLGLCLLSASLLGAPACGYRVVGSEPTLPDKPRATLAIPTLENRSLEPGLETIFANDLIRAFQTGHIVQVRSGEDRADYVLQGIIKKLEHTSTAYLDIERSLIRRATVTVEFSLKDTRSGKIVWKDVEIVRHDYVADKYYGIGEATRDQGLRQMSVLLAQRVHDKIGLLF